MCVSTRQKYVKRYYLQRILIEGAGDSDMARKELIVRLLFVQWLHIHTIVVYLTLITLYSHHCFKPLLTLHFSSRTANFESALQTTRSEEVFSSNNTEHGYPFYVLL